MVNYYKELSVGKNDESSQILEKIREERKKQIFRQNTADIDKRQEAERRLILLNDAEKIFSDAKKRADYDKTLVSAESQKRDTPVINPNAKPTRKLFDGIDYDSGNYFKTEYGQYKVISHDEAFDMALETLVKMVQLGPAQGQDTKSYHDEFVRLSRITNTARKAVEYELLDKAVLKCASALWETQDSFIANGLAQDIFYYSNEMIENRNSIDIGLCTMMFCREQVFCEYIGRPEIYREIVDAFFRVNKIDKSMPRGYYDLSYLTEETSSYQDIYYLVMCDFYVNKLLERRDNIHDEEIIDSCQRAHDLYVRFRDVLDPTILFGRKDKKQLKEIYRAALEKMKYSENNSFNKDKPYHPGLAYAIGLSLGSQSMCKKAAESLEVSKGAYKLKKKADAIQFQNNNKDSAETIKNLIAFCAGLIPIFYYLYTNHYIVAGYSFICYLIMCARWGVRTSGMASICISIFPIIFIFNGHPYVGGAIALCLMSSAFASVNN